MRKPIKLSKYQSGIFDADFNTITFDRPIELIPSKNEVEVEMEGAMIVHNPQPDWAQDDPKKPDYIKNKEIAEQYRPIVVEGKGFLPEARESGEIEFRGDKGIVLQTEGNTLLITNTLKDQIEEVYVKKEVEGKTVEDGILIKKLKAESERAKDAEEKISKKLIGIDTTVVEFVNSQIKNIPIATEDAIGLVKSSTKENMITVLEDGSMEVSSLNVNKLSQTSGDILILNGALGM